MDFLSQIFDFTTYYYLTKKVFETIGYDYYKGLKLKLPPIRYLGKNEIGDDLVVFAHPKDFTRHINIFKNAYNEIKNNSKNLEKVNIYNNGIEIFEIYPSTTDLLVIPNGFIALFVNINGMSIILNEFNINNEFYKLNFLQVTENGIDTKNIQLKGVINTFIKKFNKTRLLINKYNKLYMVIGGVQDFNIKTGYCKPLDKYNIFGGKRLYNENTIESTIRETSEELGLNRESIIYKFINMMIPRTKDIIRCSSFNVFCVYFTPRILNDNILCINPYTNQSKNI
jgi:hypothetical protein